MDKTIVPYTFTPSGKMFSNYLEYEVNGFKSTNVTYPEEKSKDIIRKCYTSLDLEFLKHG